MSSNSISPVSGKPASAARLRSELFAYHAQVAAFRSPYMMRQIVKAYCASFRKAAKEAGFYLP